jgi:hypothetical protein
LVMHPSMAVPFKVLSTYKHSLLNNQCSIPTAREILIDGGDYDIVGEFVADEEPKLFLGVVARSSRRYPIVGEHITPKLPGEFPGPATALARLNALQDRRVIVFRVTEEGRGVSAPYEIVFSLVHCRCRRYDGT